MKTPKILAVLLLLALPIVDVILYFSLFFRNVNYPDFVDTLLVVSSMIASSCASVSATIEFVKDYYEIESIVGKKMIILILSSGLHFIVSGIILANNFDILIKTLLTFLLFLPSAIGLLVFAIHNCLRLKEIKEKEAEDKLGFTPKEKGKDILSADSAVIDGVTINIKGSK